MDHTLYIIGQALGGVAILLGFLSYQTRTQRGLILMQSATALTFCAHYFLIGAIPGMALNLIVILRNTVYYYRNRRHSHEMISPILFALVMGGAAILTWNAWYSVFVLAGQIINTLYMSCSDPQKVRKSVLVTCPMVLTYDVFVFSVGGIIYESVAMTSALIGIIRNSKASKETLS
jgi:hypothetical protein